MRIRQRKKFFQQVEQIFGLGCVLAFLPYTLDQVCLATAAHITIHHMAGGHLNRRLSLPHHSFCYRASRIVIRPQALKYEGPTAMSVTLHTNAYVV